MKKEKYEKFVQKNVEKIATLQEQYELLKKSAPKKTNEPEIEIEFEVLRARALFTAVTAIAALKSDQSRNLEDLDVLIGDQRDIESDLNSLRELFTETLDKINQGESELVREILRVKSA
jgi:uncharacterized protein YktA (UPF0223 family)